jgi:membrane protein implicated in regulation of membrane protease activity
MTSQRRRAAAARLWVFLAARCHHGLVSDWLAWLIAAGVFAVAETTSLTFVLLMFAGGALAGAATAVFGGALVLQFVVAIVATLALLGAVRPVVKRHLTPASSAMTGTDALIGQEAVVLDEVDARDGRIRLNGGNWSARAFDSTQVLPAGTVVRVMKISGATALVLPEDPNFPSGELT